MAEEDDVVSSKRHVVEPNDLAGTPGIDGPEHPGNVAINLNLGLQRALSVSGVQEVSIVHSSVGILVSSSNIVQGPLFFFQLPNSNTVQGRLFF